MQGIQNMKHTFETCDDEQKWNLIWGKHYGQVFVFNVCFPQNTCIFSLTMATTVGKKKVLIYKWIWLNTFLEYVTLSVWNFEWKFICDGYQHYVAILTSYPYTKQSAYYQQVFDQSPDPYQVEMTPRSMSHIQTGNVTSAKGQRCLEVSFGLKFKITTVWNLYSLLWSCIYG